MIPERGAAMRTLRVKTVDFNYAKESEQNNCIVKALRKKYDVEVSDDPELLIYSVWGNEHRRYDCTKLFYTSEPFSPDFNECDYAIGFDPMQFGPRYLRLPLFALEVTPSIQDRAVFREMNLAEKRFCNFVYSNEFAGSGAFLRKEFCQKLMRYKKVDCPGMVLHNMDSDEIPSRYGENWYQGKLDFLRKYKFTIAFENTRMDGYTTEKLVQPFQAGSIPVYYGNPAVSEEFNRRAFVDCNAFDNDFDAVIEEIRRIDNDPELAKYMILQNPLKEGYDFAWEDRLLRFLTDMIETGCRRYDHMVLKTSDRDFNRPGTLNYRMYKQGIVQGLKEWKEIAIYGNGNFAVKIKEFLDDCQVDTVSVCLVTRAEDAGGAFMGLPVVSIGEWKPLTDCPLILTAVRENGQEELMRSLADRGYRNFLSVNDFLTDVIKS